MTVSHNVSMLTRPHRTRAGLAFYAIAPLLIANTFIPGSRPYTSKFFTLSYHNPTTNKYGAGHDDLCFVASCVMLCIGIRAALMRHVLAPLGRHLGISKTKDITRFSEQGWMLAYYSVLWPLGTVPFTDAIHSPSRTFR